MTVSLQGVSDEMWLERKRRSESTLGSRWTNTHLACQALRAWLQPSGI